MNFILSSPCIFALINVSSPTKCTLFLKTNKKCSCVTPPEDGFLEAETYVGILNVLKNLILVSLNKVHLVGDETLISYYDV